MENSKETPSDSDSAISPHTTVRLVAPSHLAHSCKSRAVIASPVRPPTSGQLLPLNYTARSIGALAFVARDTEADELARYNLRNKGSSHPTLVSTGQHAGSGMSQLGRHAVKKVAISRGAPDGVWARLLRQGIREEDVAAYASAVPVVVNLSLCSPSKFDKLSVFLGHELYDAIREQASNFTHWQELPREAFPFALMDVVEKWRRDTGRSLFIHFDGVRNTYIHTHTDSEHTHNTRHTTHSLSLTY